MRNTAEIEDLRHRLPGKKKQINELHAIPHKVGRADVVLVLTAHMSHKSYYVLKTAARVHNKKPLYYHELSIRGAVKAVAGFCHRYRGLELIS